MIDNLFLQSLNHPSIGIAFLYADHQDQSNQTLVYIFGSLLRQFLIAVPESRRGEAIRELNNFRRYGREIETRDILAILKKQLPQLKRTFICIDAVDELKPKVRQQLLKALQELVIDNNTCLFLTGRCHVIESEVQNHFKIAHGYTVEIYANQQDIRDFVRQQIKEDLNPEAMDTGLAKCIEDAIIEKSKGMLVMKFKGHDMIAGMEVLTVSGFFFRPCISN